MSVGVALAEARERAGLTLEEVSESTRIRASVIARMESDDFSACGGDVYARGHIRAIAHTLNTDPVPLIAAFDEAHVVSDVPSVTEVFEAETSTQAVRRTKPNWTAAMAVALVGVLAFGGYRLVSSGDSSGPTSVAGLNPTQSSSASPSASPTPSSPPSTPSNSDDNAVASVSGVQVALSTPNGKSWVSVTDGSGKTLYQGLMSRGAEKNFRHSKSIRVVVGNAGATELRVNGRELGTPGGDGQVVRLTFGPGDPTSAAG